MITYCYRCKQQLDYEKCKDLKMPNSIEFNYIDTLTYKANIKPQLQEPIYHLDDLRTTKNGSPYCVKDGSLYDMTNLKLFNKYVQDPIDLDTRITSTQPELLEKQNFQNYQFDNKDAYNKMSCSKSKLGVLTKLLVENDFTFNYPKIDGVYFDIETFNTSNLECPKPDDINSHISMICSVYKNQIRVFSLNRYTFEVDQIMSELAGHYDKIRDFDIQLIQCDNDALMSIEFLKYLSEIKEIHYLCGFNASQGNAQKDNQFIPNCYDLPFIMKKAGLSERQFIVSKQRYLDRYELCYSSCMSLPLTIIMDFKQLIHPVLSAPGVEEQMDHCYNLNNILQVVGITSKIEVDMIQMLQDSRVKGFNMSKYVAYCVYDCLCLKLADDKKQLFEMLYTVVKQLQLPIFALANLSDAQKLQIYILKMQYKAGNSVYYENIIDYIEQNPKYGAFTKQASEDCQFKVLKTVYAQDYASQYPSAMLQLNISPENLSDEITKNCIDINYLKHQNNEKAVITERLVYFKEKPSILNTMLTHFLLIKKQSKQTGNTTLEKSSKLLLNTTYGLMNQNSSPLYNYKCGSAITGFSRFSTDYAQKLFLQHGYIITSIDTDGFEVQWTIYVTKTPEELAKMIRDKFEYMILESEKECMFIFNQNKKAYLKLQNGKISAKGVGSKKQLSMHFRKQLDITIKELFTLDVQNIQEIRDVLLQKDIDLAKQIKLDIQQQQDLEKYAIKIKYSKTLTKKGQLTRSGYLESIYGTRSFYKVLPYNTNQKRKDYNWVLYDDVNINLDKLKIGEIVSILNKPLNTFFRDNVKKTQEHVDTLQEGQIILRNDNTQKMHNLLIEDVEQFINEHHIKTSYSEKILNDTTKLYFDIEHKQTPQDQHIIDTTKIQNMIKSIVQDVVCIHVANGCSIYKQSYHVVVDVLMCKTQMKSLANYINNSYGKDVCDLAVYKSDSSLRLPNQYKWDKIKNKLTNTLMKISGNSTLQDFIVQNTTNVMDKSNKLAFLDKHHFSFSNMQVNKKCIDYLKSIGFNCTLKDYIIIPDSRPFTCPITKIQHTNNNLYVTSNKIGCFSEQCKGQRIDIPKDLEIKQEFQQSRLMGAGVQNTKLVKFNIDCAQITFVKSAMGTGKTKQLLQELQTKKDQQIIAVSFRRSFANDFCNKMGFANYQDTQDQIDLDVIKQICIQIDSLCRIVKDSVKKDSILILDETESILSQMNAFVRKSSVKQSILTFIDLLQNCGTIIVMDALLQQNTINQILHLTKSENYQIVQNIYQPQLKQNARLIAQYRSNNMIYGYANQIVEAVKQGKKVFSFNSSRNLISKTEAHILELYPNTKILIHHGLDAKYEQCHGGELNMAQGKKQDINNLNETLTSCDVFIMSSTNTAGISFEKEHFDYGIHYFSANTCDTISAIQAQQRVRNLTDKNITIYFEKSEYSSPVTPKDLVDQRIKTYDMFKYYDIVEELILANEARSMTLNHQRELLFVNFLKEQGYNVQIEEVITLNKDLAQEFNAIQTDTISWSYELKEEDLNVLDLAKQNNYVINSNDKLLHTKLTLVKVVKILELDYKEFNKMSDECKKQMYDNLEKLSTQKTWTRLFDRLRNQEVDITQIDSIIDELRKEEVMAQQAKEKYIKLTKTQYNKQTEQYKVKIQALITLNQCITSPNEVAAICKEHGITVQSFGVQIDIFGFKLVNTKSKIDGKTIRTYKLVDVKRSNNTQIEEVKEIEETKE